MKKNYLSRQLLVFSIVFLALPSAKSQNDDHYWTQQFGAKGLLLNGAVIASTEDESAVFYNPGALGNGEDFGITLSFLTPNYAVLQTDGYLGNGTRADDHKLGFSSDLSAVGFRPFKDKRFRAAVTSFARYKSDMNLRERVVGPVENQANQLFVGNLDFKRSLSERWLGGGLAFQISDNISVGVSHFLTFHSESTALTIQKEIVERNDPDNLLLAWRSRFKYSFSTKGGMITKLGISATFDNLKLGATFTSSNYLHLIKRASYDKSDLRVYGRDSTVLTSNLTAAPLLDYKTPWSVGLGADFRIKRTRVSLSMEYFDDIRRYSVIDHLDDPFNGLANGEHLERTVVQLENREVFNVAIGLQTRVGNSQSIITGFRTDFNQRIVDPGLQTLSFLSTSPSVYHFSLGGLFKVKNNQISMGVDYAFGRKLTTGRLVDLTNITADNLFNFTETGAIKSSYQSVVFIFTYDFILKSWKDWRKRRNEMKEQMNGSKKK